MSEDRAVAAWLFGMCGMIWGMVVLGGATRLTGSGLSIMDWQPVSGILPPLSHAEWARLFALYQTIPQYRLLHEGFGLAGFKHIFWLEWLHRFWGRLTGLAFLGPLLWFAWARRLGRRFCLRLALLFLLGGLQGAVGWVMVASGFVPESTVVDPLLLTAHLAMALLLYTAVLWTGLQLYMPARPRHPDGARIAAAASSACLFATMLAGSLVAGNHAGLIDNSFPLMEGRWLPPDYTHLGWPRMIFHNPSTVQFDHRVMATVTCGMVLGTAVLLLRRPAMRVLGGALLGLVGLQYLLGVTVLLYMVPSMLALLHQSLALACYSTALMAWYHAGLPQHEGRHSAVEWERSGYSRRRM